MKKVKKLKSRKNLTSFPEPIPDPIPDPVEEPITINKFELQEKKVLFDKYLD